MNKILFVGKFNESTNHIQKYLKDYMNVQICSDNIEIVKSMIQMYKPDGILINTDEFDKSHSGIFEYILDEKIEIPTLVIGKESQAELYKDYIKRIPFHLLYHPVSNDKVKTKLEDIIDKKEETSKEDVKSDEDTSKKLILVVDDSPSMLRSMKKILENVYRVAMATSGEQALQLIDKEIPSLIILDYEMPEFDGRQTLEKIRGAKKLRRFR